MAGLGSMGMTVTLTATLEALPTSSGCRDATDLERSFFNGICGLTAAGRPLSMMPPKLLLNPKNDWSRKANMPTMIRRATANIRTFVTFRIGVTFGRAKYTLRQYFYLTKDTTVFT